MKKIPDPAEDQELVLKKLREENTHRLNMAFALMSVIPFLVFFYVIAIRLFAIDIVIGDVGLALAITLLLCFLGYLVGYSIIRNLLDRIIFCTDKVSASYDKLKETQELLIHSEKFKAIGQLAGGIAHEVKNPLATIAQGISYIEGKSPLDNITNTLNIMKDGVKRADNIINALGDFSKATMMNIEVLDVNSILETSLFLIKHKIGSENIVFTKDFDERLPGVLGDKIKIEQVFINILMNSVQAMPGGGSLFISTYKKKMTEPAAETVVVVEIEDTGSGISGDNLKKVFDPFFTTKGPKGGTGLGLSVTRNIMDMHKGLITINSKEGLGTKVTIILKSAER